VAEPTDKKPRGRLRDALSSWWRQATPSRNPAPAVSREDVPARVGPYTVTGRLGQGGMGIVYSARDERLQRAVAVKTMSSLASDEAARKRFVREARAAASVNHPNVCQIYAIGEDADEPYIAMELLEGESLAERLRRGSMSVAEMLPFALGILSALEALHARGIVHRDLKPSNVFLTPHGVKVLDFGLARQLDPDPSISVRSLDDLTRTGMVVGTPRYMAPEQITGETVDARTDLFAGGAIFFEMLAGRPAFEGDNGVAILHATLYEQPPALTGSPAVAAVDRVIRGALAKKPSERPRSAEEMAAGLRAVRGLTGDDTPAHARALTRLVVLPFRILRPDPETDFLALSLPDAIATSLSGTGSLVVRSSATAARFGGQDLPDLKSLASDADVDRVVMGTLLRSGEQLRAAVQLVEAPGGTLLTAHTVQSSLGDLFNLQDDIARRVVEALSLPLTGAVPSSVVDAPVGARAYELYLRANELARSYDHLHEARDLYARCLEEDPRFAPAWARLGRCHWMIDKYVEASPDGPERAEEALRRALELNPRLSIAHKYYASLEADTGHTRQALVRLLEAAGRHGNDPELFAGLVHASRYCGLYGPSVAAHHEARRLDPNVPTSLRQTQLMAGTLDPLVAATRPDTVTGGDDAIRVIALGLARRREEARRVLLDLRSATKLRVFQGWSDFLLAWLEGRPADMLTAGEGIDTLRINDDPEALFQEGWLLCDAGDGEQGLALLRQAVDRGYSVAPTLSGSRSFDPLRDDPRFRAVLAKAEADREEAFRAFRQAGGERLLGR